MIQIIVITINILLFGLISFNSVAKKYPLDVPLIFMFGDVASILITLGYFSSFIFILIFGESFMISLLICLALQFFINHIIWGTITGLYIGRIEKKRHQRNES